MLVMCSLRISGPFILTALLTATLSLPVHAQSPQTPEIQSGPSSSAQPKSPASVPPPSADPVNIATGSLPDPPPLHIASRQTAEGQQTDPQHGGTISGTVEDANGAEVPDALVELEN